MTGQAIARGDLDLSGQVNILDIIKNVRIIIGAVAEPDSTSTDFDVADVNNDNTIDVTDVVAQVNLILGVVPTRTVATTGIPVMVQLGNPQQPDAGRMLIPLMLDSHSGLAGLQAVFTFDPSLLDVGTPKASGSVAGLNLSSHMQDGTLRVVLYRAALDQRLITGGEAVLWIPVTVKDASAAPALTLADVVLADVFAQTAPVTLGTTRVETLPTAFALSNARPNPFNPSTTIAYEAPEQAHIRLTVYNLLGQEVIRLVDQVQAPGRYQVHWNARNHRGLQVASGVYVYRITTDTGFTDTRRMTLLK